MEFATSATEGVLCKKVLPALEELARTEFGVFTFTGGLDAEEAAAMKESERTMERTISDYLQALMEMHLKYGESIKGTWSRFQE